MLTITIPTSLVREYQLSSLYKYLDMFSTAVPQFYKLILPELKNWILQKSGLLINVDFINVLMIKSDILRKRAMEIQILATQKPSFVLSKSQNQWTTNLLKKQFALYRVLTKAELLKELKVFLHRGPKEIVAGMMTSFKLKLLFEVL